MEDGNKKKKSKKKKNKQNKSAVDNTNGVGDSANSIQNDESAQHHQSCVSEITQVQNDVPKGDVALEETVETSPRESHPLTEQQAVVEDTKIGLKDDHGQQIQKEASVEETSIGIQNDNSAHISKEAFLEDTNIGLQNDDSVHTQKEASLKDTSLEIQHDDGVDIQKEAFLENTNIELQNDDSVRTQKEASLKDTSLEIQHDDGVDIQKEDSLYEEIQRLQEGNKKLLHKEASLETKLLQLEKEKDLWLQKQAYLEEQFSHLVKETDTLKSKETSLEEKIKQFEMEKDFWFEKEKSNKETTANLNENVSRLQTQVIELEESRHYLLHENQQLGESISTLQIQIKNLGEQIASGVSSSAERTVQNVDKNADPHGVTNNNLPTVEIAEQFGNADSTSKLSEPTSVFADRSQSTMDIVIQDERNVAADDLTKKNTTHVSNSFEDVAFRSEGDDHKNIKGKDTIVADEIVQIPLDENHLAGPSALPPQVYEEKTVVPLTDSPLIGAPFRMISFFARYVSGGDLVNKS